MGKCGQCRCIHSSPPVIVVLSLVTFDPHQHLFKSAVKLSNQSFPLAAQKTSGVKGKRDSRVDQTVTSRLASVTLSIFARSGARRSVSLHQGKTTELRFQYPRRLQAVKFTPWSAAVRTAHLWDCVCGKWPACMPRGRLPLLSFGLPELGRSLPAVWKS